MHVRRLCAALFTSALASAGLVTFAAPSYATGSCGAGVPFQGATGGVVASGDENWYQTTAIGEYTITLTPQNGDADLYVYDSSCQLVCSSSAGGTYADSCGSVGTGTLNIGVVYYASATGSVTYTLAESSTVGGSGGSAQCNLIVGQTVCASLSTTTPYNTYTVYTPGSTPATVAGYVNSYEFTLPNGGKLTLPCIVLRVNNTWTDACAAAGGRYLGTVYSLVQTSGVPTLPLVNPLVAVKVCNADLVATVDGFGVSSFPLLTVC